MNDNDNIVMIETGLTGPDWEPDESMRYYAQANINPNKAPQSQHIHSFGATRAEALRNLALALERLIILRS